MRVPLSSIKKKWVTVITHGSDEVVKNVFYFSMLSAKIKIVFRKDGFAFPAYLCSIITKEKVDEPVDLLSFEVYAIWPDTFVMRKKNHRNIN
jgi:hypothetical protein